MRVARTRAIVAGESRGSIEILKPIAIELAARAYDVDCLSLGKPIEALGFGDLPYRMLADVSDATACLANGSLAIVGMTGYRGAEGALCRLAKVANIPTVGLLDNLDNLPGRLDPDARMQPDLVFVSGDICREDLRHEIEGVMGNRPKDYHDRFMIVDNVRLDLALEARSRFDPVRREAVLAEFLLDPSAVFPEESDRSRVAEEVVSGRRKLVVYFSNNIDPSDSSWRSYGHSAQELEVAFREGIRKTAGLLSRLATTGGIHYGIRPHPRESIEPGLGLAKKWNAILFPPGTGNSMELAMAAGYIATPAGSMIDQGPFHGVRTLALLYGQSPPFRFRSLSVGGVLSVFAESEIAGAIEELVSDDPAASAIWVRRLEQVAPKAPIAAQIVDRLLNAFGLPATLSR